MKLIVDENDFLQDVEAVIAVGVKMFPLGVSFALDDFMNTYRVLDLDMYEEITIEPSIINPDYYLLVVRRTDPLLNLFPQKRVLGVYKKKKAKALVRAIGEAWSANEDIFVVSCFFKNYASGDEEECEEKDEVSAVDEFNETDVSEEIDNEIKESDLFVKEDTSETDEKEIVVNPNDLNI